MILLEKKKSSYNIDWNIGNGDKCFKNVSWNSIILHRFKSKTNDFRLKRNRIKGKEVAWLQNVWQNFSPGCESYIKLHISFISLCGLFFIQLFDTNLLARKTTLRLHCICTAQKIIQTIHVCFRLHCNYVTSLLAYYRG